MTGHPICPLTKNTWKATGNEAAQRHFRCKRKMISEMAEDGIFVVTFSYEDQKVFIGRLLKKYADVPISFADACLVRMAELHPDSAVFTLDSDFKIYRRNGRQAIPLIFPEK